MTERVGIEAVGERFEATAERLQSREAAIRGGAAGLVEELAEQVRFGHRRFESLNSGFEFRGEFVDDGADLRLLQGLETPELTEIKELGISWHRGTL